MGAGGETRVEAVPEAGVGMAVEAAAVAASGAWAKAEPNTADAAAPSSIWSPSSSENYKIVNNEFTTINDV